jgi:DNA-directed RNA polymerase subunit K/omega
MDDADYNNDFDEDFAMTKEDIVADMDPGDDYSDDDPNHAAEMQELDEEEEYGLPGPVDPEDPDGGDILYPVEYVEDLSTAIDANVGEPYVSSASSRPPNDGSMTAVRTTSVKGLMKTPISTLRSSAMVRQRGVRFQGRPTEARASGTAPISKEFFTGAARRSAPFMTKYEYASLIGERATEIEHGARDIDPKIIARARELDITSSLDVAEMELEDTTVNFPMTIYRDVGPTAVEVWEARELFLPSQVLCGAHTPEATKLLLSESCPGDIQMTNLRMLKRFSLADSRI